MKIILAGATGFIGQNLVLALLKETSNITIIGRDLNKIITIFGNKVKAITWDSLETLAPDQYDVIINLSGHNIADARWTQKTKELIKHSRIETTLQLINWCLKSSAKKPHLYNASAIGVYGSQTTTPILPSPLTESSKSCTKDSEFLTEVGTAWEESTQAAIAAKIPVTLMRFAVVLKRHQGVLKKLEPAYRFGLGIVLGSGNQAFSWIDIDDLVRAVQYLLNHPDITGPVNLSAPGCVSQRDFAQALAKVMRKPLFLKMPEFAINLLFGQLGQELLLNGQNIYPERLKQHGFEFLYPDISSALNHEWSQ